MPQGFCRSPDHASDARIGAIGVNSEDGWAHVED
jgi:hypothetical protein